MTQSTVPSGISFTEFYDALELEGYRKKDHTRKLRQDVVRRLKKWKVSKGQNLVLNKIKEFDAPILTLNFDDLIPRSMSLTRHQMKHFNSNDYYPWDRYYSDRVLDTPLDGFGVWYLNGMVEYHRSIKLGLSHYMGNVDKARPLVQKAISKGKKYIAPRSAISNSWISILLSKDLFIVGAGLGESEVFVRWMLIQRAKFFRRHPRQKRKGWYISAQEDSSTEDEGRRFFLRSVGIESLTVPTYKQLYEDIWS